MPTFRTETFRTETFPIKTFPTKTFRIKTFRIKTFLIKTFLIKTFRIKTFRTEISQAETFEQHGASLWILGDGLKSKPQRYSLAKMLLDVYGHFMPTESAGFADAITAPNGTKRHPRGTNRLAAPARFPASRCKRREPKRENGADERTRTADLLITR